MRDGHHASNRSDVLSTTPASRMASENAHDNVDATELTGCVAGLELRAEELLPIFEFYCSYGQAYNLELLKVTNFTRFVRDCKLLPTKFPSGELQVLFVRSTRPVTMDAQNSGMQDKHGEHAGKVHDATCLTFANWLESLCRIATLRIELRQKRLNKLKATRDLASVVGGNATDAEVQEHESARGDARMKSMVLQKQLEQKKTMSDELDEILENNVLVHASRLELLAEGKNSWASVEQTAFWLVWLVGALVGALVLLFVVWCWGLTAHFLVAFFFCCWWWCSVGVVGTGRDGRDSFGFKKFRSDVCVLFGRSETRRGPDRGGRIAAILRGFRAAAKIGDEIGTVSYFPQSQQRPL